MNESEKQRWHFLGIENSREGQPVQAWFNALPEDHQDEIRALLVYLQNITDRLWARPSFDPLEGEPDISEIRGPEIRGEQRGEVKLFTYRIYGFFGPLEYEMSYTFLHATDKNRRNDKHGKQIARDRLAELRRGEAKVHEFDFEERSLGEIDERPGHEG